MLTFLETLLAPLLLWQGKRVRENTPRLPEPPGPRQGNIPGSPKVRLLVTGDSAAAGVGAASQEEALSGRLVARLGEQAGVEWRVIARTGLTTGATIRMLENEPAEAFDVAVVSLGVNDVTGRRSPAHFRERQQALLDLLARRFSVRHVLLTSVPPMHRFPALPFPLRQVMGLRARMLDDVLRELAAQHDWVTHLDMGRDADPAHMASDGFHPGPQGYERWAREACQALLDKLD